MSGAKPHNRIAARFAELKEQNRAGLVTYIMAGDGGLDLSAQLLRDLPGWGADFIELGMPFSDPMADGPVIQNAARRALAAKTTVSQTLQLAASWRRSDPDTPLILMGYYNPIHHYGTARFAAEAAESGVDGLIVVDLPPEEDQELHDPAAAAGLDLIRLVTPVTDQARLGVITDGASGFLYYVAITGVTGTASADMGTLGPHLGQIRKCTSLPLAAGFGIKTPDDAAAMAEHADAVVVGSALVETIAALQGGSKTIAELESQVRALAAVLER